MRLQPHDGGVQWRGRIDYCLWLKVKGQEFRTVRIQSVGDANVFSLKAGMRALVQPRPNPVWISCCSDLPASPRCLGCIWLHLADLQQHETLLARTAAKVRRAATNQLQAAASQSRC